MNVTSVAETLEEARLDRIERALRHARDCVCFAVVTPEPLAAELIDKAIDLRLASKKTVQMTVPPTVG